MTSKRNLTRRLIAFLALDEFMPIFPVYALLFSDSGLSTAEISGLLILWSVVTFVLEVPSGAWADVISRRFLLCLSSVAYGAAFACWVLFPNVVGFAVGFVLWGISSALSSGTFQALAYDELVAIDARGEYARVIGVGTSAALVAMTVATLLAAPLVALGGYALTGWASVAVCAAQFLVARSLPATPPVISVADVDAAEELAAAGSPTASAAELHTGRIQLRARSAGFVSRYFAALRIGTREATRSRLVRGAVLATALLYGMLAFDEYFGLMLSEQGSSLVLIPVLLVVLPRGRRSVACSLPGPRPGAPGPSGQSWSSPASASPVVRSVAIPPASFWSD